MHVDDASLATLRAILRDNLPADAVVYAFGSRAHGRNLKRFSDLDLCFKADKPLPPDLLGRLKTAFGESDLPFCVDCVDWHRLSRGFQEAIAQDLTPLMPVVGDRSRPLGEGTA